MVLWASVYVKYKRLAPWKVQFEALRFTESEIERLYKLFRKVCNVRDIISQLLLVTIYTHELQVDVDESGSIELVELLVHIDLERTKFTERIFQSLTKMGLGKQISVNLYYRYGTIVL